MCILFIYHALGESGTDEAPLASMDFSAAGKSAAGRGRGQGTRGRYRLIVASNRDEYLDRPTSPIHFWEDAKSSLLAGRDLVAGGTWLGVSRSGKFATVTNIPSTWDTMLEIMAKGGWTNLAALASKAAAIAAAAAAVTAAAAAAALTPERVRANASYERGFKSGGGWGAVEASLSFLNSVIFSSPPGSSLGLLCVVAAGAAGLATAASVGLGVAAARAKGRRSRGGLVADFLKGAETAEAYGARLSKERRRYSGFNLVLTDPTGAWVLSNRHEPEITRLEHGLYGVSNATLDTPWTKMIRGKSRVLQVLLRLAADQTLTEDALVDLLMDVLADETPCSPPQPPRGSSGPPAGDWLRFLQRVCVPPAIAPGNLWAQRLRLPWFGVGGKVLQGRAYGTRSSTVVLMDATGRTKVVERNLGRGNVDDGSGGGGGGGGVGGKKDGSGGGKDGSGGGKDEAAASEEMLLPMRYADRTTFEFCDV